jgi:hypothetical protein
LSMGARGGGLPPWSALAGLGSAPWPPPSPPAPGGGGAGARVGAAPPLAPWPSGATPTPTPAPPCEAPGPWPCPAPGPACCPWSTLLPDLVGGASPPWASAPAASAPLLTAGAVGVPGASVGLLLPLALLPPPPGPPTTQSTLWAKRGEGVSTAAPDAEGAWCTANTNDGGRVGHWRQASRSANQPNHPCPDVKAVGVRARVRDPRPLPLTSCGTAFYSHYGTCERGRGRGKEARRRGAAGGSETTVFAAPTSIGRGPEAEAAHSDTCHGVCQAPRSQCAVVRGGWTLRPV